MDYLDRDISIGEVGGRLAQLTEPGLFHADNNVVQPVQDTVPPPKPYKTLDDENTYSPGRTDPTGQNTIAAKPPQAARYEIGEDENPFTNTRKREED